MKRIVFLFAILLCTLKSFSSNPVLDNPNNSPYWGVRIGYDWNLPGKWDTPFGEDIDMFRSGGGFSVGAIYNIPLKANLFFEPGVYFYYDTYSYKDVIITDEFGNEKDSDPKIVKSGFRIPLSLGYRFDLSDRFSVSIFTGPQFGYAFYGNIHFRNKEIAEEYPEKLFSEYGQRRFNIDWNIGFGIEVDYRWYFSITGQLGLNDLQKNEVKFKENRLTFALGYNF